MARVVEEWRCQWPVGIRVHTQIERGENSTWGFSRYWPSARASGGQSKTVATVLLPYSDDCCRRSEIVITFDILFMQSWRRLGTGTRATATTVVRILLTPESELLVGWDITSAEVFRFCNICKNEISIAGVDNGRVWCNGSG